MPPRKQAGKHSRSKSNATSTALNNAGSPRSGSSTPTSSPNANVNASPSSNSNNTLALPSTTRTSAPNAPAAPGGIPLIYRLLLLLYPILQMLLSAEAPLRPFSAWRHPLTNELVSAREELIEPRILVVVPHVRDLGFFAPTLGVLVRTERVERCWVGVLGVSGRGSARGKGEGREEEWREALETFGSGLDVGLLDVPGLQDDPESTWDPNVVADAVLPYVLKHNVDTILTFDEGGITGNPHHTAVSRGITSLVRSQKLKDALAPPSSSSSSSSSSSKSDEKPSLRDRLWGSKAKDGTKDEKDAEKENEKGNENEKENENEKRRPAIHPRAYLLHTPTSILLNPGLGPLSSVAQHFVLVYRAFRGTNRNRNSTSTSASTPVQSSSESGEVPESGDGKIATQAPAPAPAPIPTTTFISNIWIYGRSWKALLKISEEMYLGNVLGWMVSRSLWVNEWVEVY